MWVTAACLCQGLAWLYSLLCFRVKDPSGSVTLQGVLSRQQSFQCLLACHFSCFRSCMLAFKLNALQQRNGQANFPSCNLGVGGVRQVASPEQSTCGHP